MTGARISSSVAEKLRTLCARTGLANCVGCGAAWAEEGNLCRRCWRLLELAGPVILPDLVAFGHYRGPLKRALRSYKFSGAHSTAAPLARRLAAVVRSAGRVPAVVTHVPVHPVRLRSRGYDQARLLALGVARELDRPCRSLLVRRKTGRRQSRLSPWQRATNLERAFLPRGPAPEDVLLIDDVYTTGATVGACRLALRTAGSASVRVAVAALAVGRPATAVGHLLGQASGDEFHRDPG